MRTLGTKAWAAALLSSGALGAAALAGEAPGRASGGGKQERELQVIFDGGDGDRIEIDDLAELEVGESRSYATDSGKPVTVTRDPNGYTLELDGKTMRIGAGEEFASGARRFRRHEFEHAGDEEAQRIVITDDPDHEVVFFEGRHGEHGFAFGGPGAPEAPLGVDALLDALGRNEKFRALDDATQELVRAAIRESAPRGWLGLVASGAGATRVIVKERRERPENEEE
jgi:hypothetical protein